jgi:hypothetical protein
METQEATTASAPTRAESRYPLAYDANGNPIDIPAHAVAWRVRRGGGRRGRPRHVFDAETGRQLEIPLGAGIDDLIGAGCSPDRYLLYPIDAEERVIVGAVAVTEVPESSSDDETGDDTTASAERSMLLALVGQQQTTIRQQSDTLCRALEATTSGYGTVRPVAPPPLVVEHPAPPPQAAEGGVLGNLKPEQIGELMGIAKMVFDMFKNVGGASGASPGVGP